VFEGVLHLCSGLLGVAGGLIDAALGPQASVSGGSAEQFLGRALGGFGLVRDLLTNAHRVVLSLVIEGRTRKIQAAIRDADVDRRGRFRLGNADSRQDPNIMASLVKEWAMTALLSPPTAARRTFNPITITMTINPELTF
jgi:hypothetical protein